ncbi:Uncharacterised protein [Zhongshania aliphaticivorans]|uniref:PepSY domain-containing protein n=1 Tax=Zhongshania aliphaticivorans TaxID=1470434 RepID=A0A5S9PJQ0_9GAMM|nr:hypothetical protein [Zhongshania aliphaticivorans]CAA0104243.1 Uncharacterised protein [Zhongshania aliphaticivorans]CAA0104444.1 Uncharacterised protein [Zhongshania aliphaticivorans]
MHYFDGVPLYQVWHKDGEQQRLSSTGEELPAPELSCIKELAGNLMSNETPAHYTVLSRYDNYYFSRHPERGGKPLPVLRVVFNDDANTWFHIDMSSGKLLNKSTSINRAYRWLYNGLHSWDFIWLWERRPLWDIVVISFSLGGLSLSLFGVVVGWRRINRILKTPYILHRSGV